jgi:sporulation-control protein spo0M
MSFVDKLGAAVGIGIARLGVSLDAPDAEYEGGDILRGTITTHGGKVPEVGRLTVALVERWETTVVTGQIPRTVAQYLSHAETVVMEGLELPAEEVGPEFRFALTMIPDADLSHGWSVGALFESSEAVDSVASADFTVAVPAPIRGLRDAVPAVAAFELYNLYNNGPEYHLDYRAATPEVKDRFDSVHLTVTLDRDADTLNGQLLVNPQEHTLVEHLQSLVQANNRAYPLALKASEAARGADGPAVAALRALLESDPANAPRS